jgi:hypothetical protein
MNEKRRFYNRKIKNFTKTELKEYLESFISGPNRSSWDDKPFLYKEEAEQVFGVYFSKNAEFGIFIDKASGESGKYFLVECNRIKTVYLIDIDDLYIYECIESYSADVGNQDFDEWIKIPKYEYDAYLECKSNSRYLGEYFYRNGKPIIDNNYYC